MMMATFGSRLATRRLCTGALRLSTFASRRSTPLQHVTIIGRAAAAASVAAAVAQVAHNLPSTSCAAAAASVVPARCLIEADKLFDSNQYKSLTDMLRASMARAPDDAELNWRLARALKKLSDGEKPKSKEKEALVREGLECAKKALAAAAQTCGPAHKWYAILLSGLGEFTGTADSIKNSFVVREHFEMACSLSPTDATARHLLGLWCYEVAKLSWFEQKAAAAFFASPPKSSFEEALTHFERAEQMEPGFYPKNLLLLANTCAKLGRTTEAKAWLEKCLAAKQVTPEDEETVAEARKLKL